MNAIVFTGGGTAGHVIPNIALIEKLIAQNWKIDYIGSYQGMEKNLIEAFPIDYHAISTGKLRRYFSWQNFIDPFKLIKGFFQSYFLFRRLKPNVIFSKGGFVAVPCVIAGWLRGIPVIAHESDLSPGLANKLCFPFARQICVNFETTKRHFSNTKKVAVTGTPIRQRLFEGDKNKALTLCGFSGEKPCLLITGGGLGAQAINQCLRDAVNELTKFFCIIHLCGHGKVDGTYLDQEDYYQCEFAGDEMADFYALSDLVVSRAGANTVCEVIALKKPHIFIPLSKNASRGDQIQNANYFAQKGISYVLEEESLSPKVLTDKINHVFNNQNGIIKKLDALSLQSATDEIVAIINSFIEDDK